MEKIKWNKNVKNSCCPYCGGEEYYYRQSVYGYAFYNVRFDGEETDNSEMYQYLQHREPYGEVKCRNCERVLGKLKKGE